MSRLDGRNCQSPIASVQGTRSTLAGHSAGPRGTNTTPTNANRAIRIAAQRTQGLRGPNSVVLGGDNRQRSLVIRIAAITLASDSAITIARFRPSKPSKVSQKEGNRRKFTRISGKQKLGKPLPYHEVQVNFSVCDFLLSACVSPEK